MTGIAVRQARSDEIALLVSFNQRMARETEDKELDPERLAAGVQAVFDRPARGTYYVAEDAGRSVGACLVTPEWSDWRGGDFWWLQSVFVEPEARGRGVFRALYGHVLDRAREGGGVCGLRLYVERENERAQAVYRAVGMQASHYRLFEVDFVLGPQEGGRPR